MNRFIVIALLFMAVGRICAQEDKSPAADFERIDAHVHVLTNSPAFVEMLSRLNLRVLNICVVDKYERGYEQAAPQHEQARQLFRATDGRAAWCSTFDPQEWEQPGFAQTAIRQLEETFQDGAVAVKIYKSIGMDLRSRTGPFLLPDDPVFTPILQFIARHNRTLFAHLAEPAAAWQPLDPASPHYGYYQQFPAWHMFGHPERPTKEAILAARDRLLAQHPRLKNIGCHLGSMEEDVDQIARRFDTNPNFAVDTAARLNDLMLQPRGKVRAFLIKYQDRVLYGTDRGLMPWDHDAGAIRKLEEGYARDWKYFATAAVIRSGNHDVQGLDLPRQVLRKLYRDNALRWIPGLLNRPDGAASDHRDQRGAAIRVNARGTDEASVLGSSQKVESAQGAERSAIFSDDFENDFPGGWERVGNVPTNASRFTITPTSGAHSVRLMGSPTTGKADCDCHIWRVISTVGMSNIQVSFYLGAAGMDSPVENVQALWVSDGLYGRGYHEMKTIKGGDAENDGALHAYTFALPAEADNNPKFALSFAVKGLSATNQCGYVDDIVVTGVSTQAENWPAWRGPLGTGVANEKHPPLHWGTNENVCWRTPLPDRGNSTPIVWDSRVFVTQAIEAEKRRTLLCLDRATGRMLWQQGTTVEASEPTHETNPQGSSSPVTDGERVIVWFGSAGVFCYDFLGNQVWHRALGPQRHIWGWGLSPMLHGNLCYLNFGPGEPSFLVALDKNTGKELWRVAEPNADSGEKKPGREIAVWTGSWSTPVMIKADEREELILSWPKRVIAFEPMTGRELWSCTGINPLVYTSPLYEPSKGILVAMGGYNGMALAVKAGGAGDVTESRRLWQHPKTKQRIGSGVIHDGRIYILNDPGVAECFELETGKLIWEERLRGPVARSDNWSSMVLADRKLFAINQGGDAFVLRASPKFDVLATNSLGEATIASMAVSDGDLFIRTQKALWCIRENRN